MKVIGLCGGSGSGKGMVCRIFAEKNIPCIDTDAVYRELTSQPGPCLYALAEEFGKEIITEGGFLNREYLRKIVFGQENSETKLKRLNEISHNYILEETRRRLIGYENDGALIAIVDAPVLFESGFDSECDVVVSVIADREIRIDRIMNRDSVTRDAAEKRIDAQLSDKEIISRSDFVIYNNSDIDTLRERVNFVLGLLIDN